MKDQVAYFQGLTYFAGVITIQGVLLSKIHGTGKTNFYKIFKRTASFTGK